MKKSVFVTLILCTLSLFITLIPTVYATESVASSYGFAYSDAVVGCGAVDPSGVASASAYSMTFKSGTSGYLTKVRLALYTSIGTTAVLRVRIEGCGNSKTGNPNGTIFATSTNTINSTTLEYVDTTYSNAENYVNDFLFNGTYALIANQYYAFVFYVEAADYIASTNKTGVYLLTDTAAFDGEYDNYSSSAWGAGITTTAITHEVIVSNTYGGDEDPIIPLPTGGLNVDTTDADVVMSALIDYGVPVVVMLLPVLFLWLIGGRGKWPFLMGIAIGTGMGYLFGLVPVWLVFIVSIVEIGMAYQSVRSGN